MLAEREERVIVLDPHATALSYLSNSTVLKFFESLGVQMDQFYRFLWRHIFVVEILKRRFDIAREDQQLTFFNKVRALQKSIYRDAFAYLQNWGTQFFATTEERIKETTQKVETSLEASADATMLGVMRLGAKGAEKLTEEQKIEFHQRGQEVIDGLQLHHLNALFGALNEEFLTDSQKRYYFLVDRRDEDWVDEPSRYRLIRALIEVMRDANSRIDNAKVVVALRVDLFERVLRTTTDAGFQDEKYRGLTLPIVWRSSSLIEVLDRRVSALVRFRYTGQVVSLKDVMPAAMGKPRQRGIDYMVERTLFRPRDAIAFFNTCMSFADGDPVIGANKLIEAESIYSDQRLRSLSDEWSVQYPKLAEIAEVLRDRPSAFRLSELKVEHLDDLALAVLDGDVPEQGEDVGHITKYYEAHIKQGLLRIHLAMILHRTGIIGLRTRSNGPIRWAYDGQAELPISLINDGSTVHVHKMLWKVLNIKPVT